MATLADTLEYFESKGLDTTEALILARLHLGTNQVQDLRKGIATHIFARRLNRLKRKHRLIQTLLPDQEEDGRIGRYELTEQGKEFMKSLPA